MTTKHHQVEFDCSHDRAHPDHLICIEKKTVDTSKKSDTFSFIKKRYDTYYHPKRSRFLLHLWVDITLGTTVALLGMFVIFVQFTGPVSFTKLTVALSLDSGEVISGAMTSFSVVIKNTSGEILSNNKILIRKPINFVILEPLVQSNDSEQVTINLDHKLAKNESRTIIVRGVAIGEIDEEQYLSLSVQGTPKKNELVQSEIVKISFAIEDTSLDSINELPNDSIIGNQLEGNISIINQSSIPIDDIRVNLEMPRGFEQKNTTPLQTQLFIKHLDANEKYRIPIHGMLSALITDNAAITLTISLNRQGSNIIQRHSVIPLSLKRPALSLQITPSTPFNSLKPGIKTMFKLIWKNNSNKELSSAVIGVRAEGTGFNNSSLISSTALTTKKLQLVWTKNQEVSLKHIAPQATGSIIFAIQPIPKPIEDLADTVSSEDTLYPFGSYVINDKTYTVSGDLIELPIDTTASLRTSLRYFSPEGDQIGRGPFPPKVGKVTTFYGFIDISSSIHPIENAIITAIIPPTITLSKIIPPPEGAGTFDEKSHTVTWNIGTVSSRAAQPSRQTGIILELNYTPTTSSKSSDTVIGSIILKGVDAVTKAPTIAFTPNLTLTQLNDK